MMYFYFLTDVISWKHHKQLVQSFSKPVSPTHWQPDLHPDGTRLVISWCKVFQSPGSGIKHLVFSSLLLHLFSLI